MILCNKLVIVGILLIGIVMQSSLSQVVLVLCGLVGSGKACYVALAYRAPNANSRIDWVHY